MTDKLKQYIKKRCLITRKDAMGDFKLSSGKTAGFYFDCKKVMLDGEMLTIIADRMLDIIEKLPGEATAISGLTLGADPIIAGVIVRANARKTKPVRACIVRKEPKKHGTKNHIENDLGEGTPIVVVDDVITTGGSIEQACDHLIAAGYKVVGILAIIDRLAGGAEHLKEKYGCTVHSLYTLTDFPETGHVKT